MLAVQTAVDDAPDAKLPLRVRFNPEVGIPGIDGGRKLGNCPRREGDRLPESEYGELGIHGALQTDECEAELRSPAFFFEERREERHVK